MKFFSKKDKNPDKNGFYFVINDKNYLSIALYEDKIWYMMPEKYDIMEVDFHWIMDKNTINALLMDRYEPVLKKLAET